VDSGEKNVFGTSLYKKAGKAGTGVLAEYKFITGASEVDNLVMYSLSSVIKPIFSFGSHDNTLIFNKPIIADVKHHKSIQAEADGGRGEDTINFGDIASKENQVFNMEYTFDRQDVGEWDKEHKKYIKGGTLTLSTDYLAEESGDESRIVAKNFETFVLPSLRGAINKFVYKPGYKIGSELDGVKTLKITSSEGTKSNELNFKGADDVRIQFYGAAEKNTVDGTENDDIIVTKELEKTPERQQGSTFHGWGGDDTLVGTNVSDSLYGDDGRDIIDGKGGADKLYGGLGNDIIAAYEASEVVDGGDGIDKVDYHNASKGIELDLNTQTVKFAKRITERVYDVEYGNQKNIVSMEQAIGSAFGDKLYGFEDKTNFIMGYKGNDHIFGGNADDVLNGGEGHDELYGKNGNDNLAGKEGNDRLYGEAGNDHLYGGLGADELYGGNGDDVMFTEFLSEREHEEVGSSIYDYADGGAGNDRIYGSGKVDSLIGGLGDDKLYGRGGDDQIYGGEGDDHIEDVDGKNYINAGAGDDTVYDYHGNDIVVGGDGYDYLDYTKMNDYMAEAEGSNLRDIKIDLENNKFSYNDGEAKEHGIYEFEAVIGSDMAEEIIGTEIDNNIAGNGGSDTIYARAGNDTVKGGDGDDKIFGEAGGDKLYGGLGSDEIDGGSGDDTIYGEQGDDVLVGGAGDDFMAGGIGNDELIGGAGDDKMFGGLGDDTYRFSGHDFGDDSIYDPAAGNDKIVFEGLGSDDLTFDRNGKDLVINSVREDGGRLTVSDWFAGADHKMDIVSSDGYDFTEKIRAKGLANDVIRGDEKANELYGKVGDDELHGLGGADKLYGGIGNDKLYGGDGNDELYGGDGNDNLYAGNGDVRLEGGAGNDLYHIDKDSSGHKTIYTENGANENIIMNDAAFFTSNIELEKQDDDLTITFKDKNNSAITIEDWFAGDEHKIGINEGLGGVKNQFTVSQIDKLIHDMAIFEGDSGVGVVDSQSGNTENPIGEIFNPEDNPFGEIEPC
jgi:Ca2+-binding RTX toxin-like protein